VVPAEPVVPAAPVVPPAPVVPAEPATPPLPFPPVPGAPVEPLSLVHEDQRSNALANTSAAENLADIGSSLVSGSTYQQPIPGHGGAGSETLEVTVAKP
jgi:hypothetical protein